MPRNPDLCCTVTILSTITVTAITVYLFIYITLKPVPIRLGNPNEPILFYPSIWSSHHPAHPVQLVKRLAGLEAAGYAPLDSKAMSSAMGVSIIALFLAYAFIFSFHKVFRRVQENFRSGESLRTFETTLVLMDDENDDEYDEEDDDDDESSV